MGDRTPAYRLGVCELSLAIPPWVGAMNTGDDYPQPLRKKSEF